jgi:hypothetical protein
MYMYVPINFHILHVSQQNLSNISFSLQDIKINQVFFYTFTNLCPNKKEMLRFPLKNDVQFVYSIICFLWIWFVICIDLLVSNTIPDKMMAVYFNSKIYTVSKLKTTIIIVYRYNKTTITIKRSYVNILSTKQEHLFLVRTN